MADPALRARGEAFNRTLRTVERDLERAYFGDASEPEAVRLTRAVASTLLSDLPGLRDDADVSPAVAAALAATLADPLALVEALTTAPLPAGSRPFIADPAPYDVPPTDTQAGQKTELPTMTVSVAGSYRDLDLIGATTDVGEGPWVHAQDAVVLRVAAAATIQTARYLVSKLSGASVAAADIGAALAAIEAAGYVPDLIVSSRSAFVREVPGVVPAAYPSVAYGPTGTDLYVVSRAGIVCLLDPEISLRATEPHLAGHQISAFRVGVFVAGTGAIQKVT